MNLKLGDPRVSESSWRRPWLTLGCLAMLQFLIAVDVTVVNIALPSIGTHFDVGTRGLTWVVVGYTITGGGLLMLGGRLGDLLGKRRVLLAGTSVFGAASLLAGLAPTFPLLVVARLLQGVGEALALPSAMALIILAFPEGPRRTRALSVWAAVASTGLVLGFVLSGTITELLGWRWIFLIAIPFIVVVMCAVLVLVPRDTRVARTSLDVPGSILLTAAPLLFVFGVIEAGEENASPWLASSALAGAVTAGVLFVVVERTARNPLVPPSFLANRGRVLANGATALLSAALSTSFLLFTLHLQERAGLTPLEAGVALLPLAVALVAAVTFVPRLIGRWGARTCAVIGIALTAFGMIAIAVAASSGTNAPAMLPAMVLIAAGMGFGLVGLQYAAVTGVTEDDAGVASGVQRAADQLGGSTGITLYIGAGFSPALSGFDPFVASSVLATAGLVAACLLAARISGRRTTS
ncbi:MFS transporter, DHA2 family, lincomycin resistance protein [Prauserella marina]|uniref:MFS transporter, DHA2 family, lincomycin resistance protein n=1 Tax=Prauserella marina TaxID=530584 RepID=A0A1G6QBA5_9PSEU|nr:MFS transporter [Prauserella marina]PWV78604.1 DHA2 family lincomycin resistance protein-like MFS transporter [Prauserella marina]SDC89772.1 MFS transporter, DHA2 family, lincomycin resistance protein [Prauserella marina]